jgi:hypothetical protein
MKRTRISTYFLFISIFTLLTILVTIIQKSYSNLIGPIDKVQTASYEKITNTSLDLEIIDEIETRSINFDDQNSSIINYIISSPSSVPASSSANQL